MRGSIGAILLLACLSATAEETDACRKQVPSPLQAALSKSFPEFRTPLATDNPREDIEFDLKEGRQGCLGVAIADFDGDAANDVLLGLTSLRGSKGLIVVALARAEAWQLHTLSEWSFAREALYVFTSEPGSYERAGSLDGPLEAGELETLECPHPFAIFGHSGASGVAYCYGKESWQHVWFSD